MLPSGDDPIPRPVERGIAFVLAGAAGTVAAAVTLWALLAIGVGGDGFFGAAIVHGYAVVPVAAGAGVLVGLASASGRTGNARMRRGLTMGLGLLVTGTVAILAWAAIPETDFNASAFRRAAAGGDLDAMETQAHRAVDQESLVGLSDRELRAALGNPDRVGRRHRQWVWDLGMINDVIGPGDGGALYVRFDPAWKRVVAAKVDQVGY